MKYLVFIENMTLCRTVRQSPLRIKKQIKIGGAASMIPVAQVRKPRFKGTKRQCHEALSPDLEPRPFLSILGLCCDSCPCVLTPFAHTCLPSLFVRHRIASEEKQDVSKSLRTDRESSRVLSVH